MEQYDKAIDGLAACIGALFDQAMLVAEDYWNFVNKMEGRQTGRDSKSSLQLSCQLKGNHIEAKWSGIKWYGQKASRYSLRVPIPKSKTTSSYAKNKLKEFSKEWEWDKVCEAEEKLTAIRRQQHHVVRAILLIKASKKLSESAPTIDSPDADFHEQEANISGGK